MKRNFILFSLLLIGISFSASAKKVEISDARLIAKNTWYEQVNRHDAVPYQSIAITGEYVEKYTSYDVYYIFNINDNGFVILSADDICYPVIGFSFEGNYSPSNKAEGFVYWMDLRAKEIAYNIENNVQANQEITSLWKHLSTKDISQLENTNKAVQDVLPLITSNFDQGYPYNSMVPADAGCSSFDGHVTVGCVATTMAQLMYYWRWPKTGNSSHGYTSAHYGYLFADFGATTYDWEGIPNQPSKECNPVALLSYHAGIGVNMNYNSDGACSSGAYSADMKDAMKNYFKYSSSITYAKKINYSTANWNSLLQGDLDIGQPLYYSGSGPGGGHAWVCDGYQSPDYYHFNLGWSGSSNGYYYLNNINPGGYTFNNGQEAVVHVFPDPAQYPLFCTGNTNVSTYDFGSIEDGSGPVANYQNNANCSWLIAPDDSVNYVKLTFSKFNTDAADFVTVYDGATTSDPVLGTFSGSTVPSGTIQSTGPKMLVKFVSNSSITAPGFLAMYEISPVSFCNTNTTLTDVTGSFSDNSNRFQYRNSTLCKWFITPTNATSITINFNNFNTEDVNDKVQVYNTVTNPPVKLVEYSGDHTALPLDPVTIPSGKGLVVWSSNKSIRGEGWDASYSVTVGTNDQKAFEDLSVFPNPTNGWINIQFTMTEIQSVRIDVLSMKGENVYSQNLGNFKGTFDKQVDLSSLAKGVYILRLTSDHGSSYQKVVLN
ncbi:MAG: C10 family peptidase [Bacteroidetes bacterium]|nr:C10 family peptidase [Bacteroidota bacterium]